MRAWCEAQKGVEPGAGAGAWWEPPVVWEEVELALEPWRVSGRGEVMAMAASLREIAAASSAGHGPTYGVGEDENSQSRGGGGGGGGGGGFPSGDGGIDTPTLTMCFCELLRQVTNHCSERGRLMVRTDRGGFVFFCSSSL